MSALFDDLPAAPPRADLPPLRGSEKQRRWAEDLRARLLRDAEQAILERRRLLAIWEERGRDVGGLREELRRMVDRLAAWEREDRSWVWIDNREKSAVALLGGGE